MVVYFRPELIAVDIDGTLVGRCRDVAAVDRLALLRACRQGIAVALCTGRVAAACVSVFAQLPLAGSHIFFDGAVIADAAMRQVVYESRLERGVLAELVTAAAEHGVFLELFTAAGYFVERENEFSRVRSRFFGLTAIEGSLAAVAAREPVIKAGLIVHGEVEMSGVEAVRRDFDGRLEFSQGATPAFPELNFINVLSPGITKGAALQRLAAHLGIAPAAVMAIGDHLNDIPLLAAAGCAVAMGNAPGELRRQADYVTTDVEHGGVARALEELVFGAG